MVSDFHLCKDSTTVNIYEPNKLVVSVTASDSVNCFAGSDGSINTSTVG
ncbi:MAG: hypothetical protein RLZZ184_2829, partial [Cyanobacteriota bacterium]